MQDLIVGRPVIIEVHVNLPVEKDEKEFQTLLDEFLEKIQQIQIRVDQVEYFWVTDDLLELANA